MKKIIAVKSVTFGSCDGCIRVGRGCSSFLENQVAAGLPDCDDDDGYIYKEEEIEVTYDFSWISGISTELLGEIIEEGHCIGSGLDCSVCRYGCNGDEDYHRKEYVKAFKEELKRREGKDMNEMPELKAGMIVDYDGHGFLLCLPKTSGVMGFYKRNLQGAEDDITKIRAIYINNSDYHYKAVFDDGVDRVLKPIWSRKSGNDIKIEALEKTIKTAMEQIEELKK